MLIIVVVVVCGAETGSAPSLLKPAKLPDPTKGLTKGNYQYIRTLITLLGTGARGPQIGKFCIVLKK